MKYAEWHSGIALSILALLMAACAETQSNTTPAVTAQPDRPFPWAVLVKYPSDKAALDYLQTLPMDTRQKMVNAILKAMNEPNIKAQRAELNKATTASNQMMHAFLNNNLTSDEAVAQKPENYVHILYKLGPNHASREIGVTPEMDEIYTRVANKILANHEIKTQSENVDTLMNTCLAAVDAIVRNDPTVRELAEKNSDAYQITFIEMLPYISQMPGQ